MELDVRRFTEFQWDDGNRDKNFIKHSVTTAECEEVFKNRPILVTEDIKHSQKEARFWLLGKTNESRKIFVVFTIREEKLRVISARDMDKWERKYYEETESNSSF